MLKSLKIISLFVMTSASFNLNAQDGHIDVPWTGTPGEVEAAVIKWRYWYICIRRW